MPATKILTTIIFLIIKINFENKNCQLQGCLKVFRDSPEVDYLDHDLDILDMLPKSTYRHLGEITNL